MVAAVAAGGNATDDARGFAARVQVAAVVLGFGFFAVLLPVLLTVAWTLMAVDAGRGLRAIRRRGRTP